MSATDLARRATITELVATYQSAVDDIRQAFSLIHAAEQRLGAAFSLSPHCPVRIRDRRHACVSFDDPASTLDLLKRDVWSAIVDRLEVRAVLSVARAKELDLQLDRGDLPEIAVATVEAFARGYLDNLDAIHREAVAEVFEFLRPHHATHKTNTEFAIGRKVILAGWLEEPWLSAYRVSHWREQQVTALENVFSALDGKGQIHKGYRSELQQAINATALDGDGRGSTVYFAYRCFHNRNLHIEFRRLDLVKRLNQIAGGMRLEAAS